MFRGHPIIQEESGIQKDGVSQPDMGRAFAAKHALGIPPSEAF